MLNIGNRMMNLICSELKKLATFKESGETRGNHNLTYLCTSMSIGVLNTEKATLISFNIRKTGSQKCDIVPETG